MFITVTRFNDGEEISLNTDHISYIYSREGKTDIGTLDDSVVEIMESRIEVLGQIERLRSQSYIRDSVRLIQLFHPGLYEVKGKE